MQRRDVYLENNYRHGYHYEDEISLTRIWRIFVKRKKTIIFITVIVTALSLVYAFIATPVYKAKTTYLPPSISDIQALNIEGINKIDVKTVYNSFKVKLLARSPRQSVLKSESLFKLINPDLDLEDIDDKEAAFDAINEEITISTPRTQNRRRRAQQNSKPTVTLSMKGKDPIALAKLVNDIAEGSLQATTMELISDVNAKIAARSKGLKQNIQLLREQTKKQRNDEILRLETADRLKINSINDQIKILRNDAKNERIDEISRLEEADSITRKEIKEKINTLRNSAKEKRFDRLAVLQEAAGIARSLKIKDAIGFKLQKIKDSPINNTQVVTDITDDTPLPYTRGYEAIEAEILSLANRKTDDPFISSLRGLQDQLKQLESNEKIIVLQARENDDPFIPELRALQKRLVALKHNRVTEQLKDRSNDDPYIRSLREKETELARLKGILIDPKMVTVAQLVRAAYPPKRRVKPQRKKIVMIGLILGFVLGIFIAFFMNFLENERKKSELETV